jgi:hypothetical protein
MTIHICCLLAMLLADPAPEMTMTRGDERHLPEGDWLISRNEAIADIDRVCVSLETQDAPYAASFEDLAAQVVEKLKATGLEHVVCKTGLTPRLRIQVETVSLEGCGRSVCRVQTGLSRLVTFADHRELTIQADVWRLRPVIKVVADPELGAAVAQAVLTQAEVFATACQAARRLHKAPAPTAMPQVAEGSADSPAAAAEPLFVASKNSAVFHRADCSLALKIAQRNLVTYATREEAIAAGKRPCKSCQP